MKHLILTLITLLILGIGCKKEETIEKEDIKQVLNKENILGKRMVLKSYVTISDDVGIYTYKDSTIVDDVIEEVIRINEIERYNDGYFFINIIWENDNTFRCINDNSTIYRLYFNNDYIIINIEFNWDMHSHTIEYYKLK